MKKVYVVKSEETKLLTLVHNSLLIDENVDVSEMLENDIINEFQITSKDCCFILPKFEGVAFDHLRNLNMIIFGPQLLLNCLRTESSLPKVSMPIFCNVLNGFTISFTKISSEDREEYTQKIHMMQGEVSGDLTEDVNVLICGAIGTPKYRVSGQRNVALMKPVWIDHIWNLSKTDEVVDALSPNVVSECKIGIFDGLTICVSGLTKEERKNSEELIITNGGVYTCSLVASVNTHLITHFATGQKYAYAEKWKMKKVTIDWLTESVVKGYYLDEEDYVVPFPKENDIKCSTPLSGGRVSMDISMSEVTMSQVNETQYLEEDAEITGIFSGCCVSMASLQEDGGVMEKLASIVTSHGGVVCVTKLEELAEESVTHTVVAAPVPRAYDGEMGAFVTPDWVQQSAEQGRLLPVPEPASVGKVVCDNEVTICEDKRTTPTADTEDWSGMEQYFEEDMTKVDESRVSTADESVAIDEEDAWSVEGVASVERRTELSGMIVGLMGRVVTGSKAARYHVTEEYIVVTSDETPHINWVTPLFVERSAAAGRLLDLDEHPLHRPLVCTRDQNVGKPLRNTVLAFSGQPLAERTVLKALCRRLGATVQDKMSRSTVPTRDLLATTHLLLQPAGKNDNVAASDASAKKVRYARKWGLPVITADWLRACVADSEAGDDPVDTAPYEVHSQLDQTAVTIATCTTSSSLNDTLYDRVSTGDPGGRQSTSAMEVQDSDLNQMATPKKTATTTSTDRIPEKESHVDSLNPFSDARPNAAGLAEFFRTPEPQKKRGARQKDKILTTPELGHCLRTVYEQIQKNSVPPQSFMDVSISDVSRQPNSGPLSTAVVFISMSASSKQLELRTVVSQLGGQAAWVYDTKTVTHVVCTDTMRNATELQNAAKDGKKVVRAEWLAACEDAQMWVDEAAYRVEITGPETKKRPAPPLSDDEQIDTIAVPCKRSKDDDVSWSFDQQQQDKQMQKVQVPSQQIHESMEVVVKFSGLEKEQRDSYSNQLKAVGVQVDTAEVFLNSVTHLVCSTPSRNEKYLAALASGKWILHNSVIDVVARTGHWPSTDVELERYEWGGGGAETVAALRAVSASKKDVQLAAAARKWRQAGGAAFKDWPRVCMVGLGERTDRLATIIELGGGAVLPLGQGSPSQLLITGKPGCLTKEPPAILQILSSLSAECCCYRVDVLNCLLLTEPERQLKVTRSMQLSKDQLNALIREAAPAVSTTPIHRSTRRNTSRRS